MTPERNQEADYVELLYYYALTQIGVQTIEEALQLWDDVPRDERAATASRWLSEAIDLVLRRRTIARQLALSYYRLVRALRTGSTYPLPGEQTPETVTLQDLRLEFEALVDDIEASAPDTPPSEPVTGDLTDENGAEVYTQPTTAADALDKAQEALSEASDSGVDDTVDFEDLPEEVQDLLALLSDDELAQIEASELLDALGVENLLKKLAAIDNGIPGATLDSKREEAHRKAGARQAAVAERITMNAARGLVYDLGEFDGKVLGWVRYSTTGTPCGFCAMLLSRGFTKKSGLYTSAQSAQRQGRDQDENKYHDNCHCIAVPVFLREQLDSPLFALNRQYQEEWPRVTQGLGGDAALSAWRKHIRLQQKQSTQAQAAAA